MSGIRVGRGRVLVAGLFLLLGAGTAAGQGEIQGVFSQPPPSEPAVVYVAKRVVTMEASNPSATAVAVQGGRIVAAGSLDEVKGALGKNPYRVDQTFAGKVVLPGLIDQHLHPFLGALTLAVEVIAPEEWVLPGRTFRAATTQAEFQARMKEALAKGKDPKEWFITWGYHALWHGKLDRKALDALSTTRPIAVWQRSCHEFFFNSAALAAMGLTEEATKGKGAWSDQADVAAGHFWEGGLNFVVPKLLPVLANPERFAFGLKQMVTLLHANGVTAFNEPGALVTPAIWKGYQQILGDPGTPFYSLFIADGRGIVDQVGIDKALDVTEKLIAPSTTGKVSFLPKQIKLFADGAVISQLMQMKDGYLDGHKGEWILPPDELMKRARLYWNAGYQVHVHVNGDLGLEAVLDTFEALIRESPRPDHRLLVSHFANSTEEQVGRIARLGAFVSSNPYYPVGFADMYSKVGLGPERADAMVRSASVVKHGIPYSFHSDLPMAPADPLFLAWCAVNRITPSGRVAGPGQRIGIDAALRGITIEAARSWRKENEIGSIAPGKVANFTVLEEDPYAVPPEKLKDVPVWGTVFEGRVFPVPAANRKGTAAVPARAASRPAAPWEGHSTIEGHGAIEGNACHLAEISQLFARAMEAAAIPGT